MRTRRESLTSKFCSWAKNRLRCDSDIRSGEIKPLLARTYPLSEIRRAQTDFMAKGFFGNLVVLPGT